jgi:hypothetical protein
MAPPVAQPVASVQPPFHLHRSSTKPRTNFFPHHAPAISVPVFQVLLGRQTSCSNRILSGLTSHRCALNSFQN